MNLIKNKKAQTTGHVSSFINGGTILAGIALIFVLIFLAGGGAKTAFDIGNFFSKVPVVFWVFLGIIFLFKIIRK